MSLKRSSRLRIVARGDGWALYWPANAWLELDESERQAVIARQARLLGRETAAPPPQANRLLAEAGSGHLAANVRI